MERRRSFRILLVALAGALAISGCSNIQVSVERPSTATDTPQPAGAAPLTATPPAAPSATPDLTSASAEPTATGAEPPSQPSTPATVRQPVAEGTKLHLGTDALSLDPASGNVTFECYGECSYSWPMALTEPLRARSYGYSLMTSRRFHLKLTLDHQGQSTVLVNALRLPGGSPAEGTVGGSPLVGAPGDVLTLELTLPDGGAITAHSAGDSLFGGGGSSSFITLSSAEPPPSPTPEPVVGARFSSDRSTTGGPAISVGPDDVMHLTWAARSGGAPAILYSASADGGVSFSPPVVVAAGADAEARGAPVVTGGPDGSTAVAWEEKLGDAWVIAFSRSSDGLSFATPVQVGAPGGSGDRSEPTIAMSPDGTVFLAWRDLSVGEQGGIFFARATVGDDFGEVTEISPFPERQADPKLVVDKQGRVHLAWTDRRDGPPAVFYARADDGITFGDLRRISETGNQIPSLALDSKGALHLGWASTLLYVYHTGYATSSDGGDNFSPGTMLSDGGKSVSAVPPYTAVGVTVDGTAYVAFLTDSPRDGKVIHYDRRVGGSFGTDVTVAGGPGVARPAMAIDSRGRLYLAWGDSGQGPLEVYVARAEGGEPFDLKNVASPTSPGIASAKKPTSELTATPMPSVPAGTTEAVPTEPSATKTPWPTPPPTSTPATDHWVRAGLPAAKVMSLAISPDYAKDKTVFAGTGWEDVFRTTDGGDTWDKLDLGVENASILALVLSPSYGKDATLYASTGTAGVFRSTDAGDTWQDVNQGLTDPKVPALAVSPDYSSDQTVYAGTGAGVFRSTDGGDTWAAVNIGLTSLNVEAMAISPYFAADGTIFASVEGTGAFHDQDGGVFRSTDRGATWTAVNEGLHLPWVKSLAISPDYSNDATLFAGNQYAAVFRSTDGGNTWQQVNVGLWVYALAISPTYAEDRAVFFNTMNSVARSEDGGNTWTEFKGGTVQPGGEALAVSPRYASDGTVFSSVFGAGACKLVHGSAQ